MLLVAFKNDIFVLVTFMNEYTYLPECIYLIAANDGPNGPTQIIRSIPLCDISPCTRTPTHPGPGSSRTCSRRAVADPRVRTAC